MKKYTMRKKTRYYEIVDKNGRFKGFITGMYKYLVLEKLKRNKKRGLYVTGRYVDEPQKGDGYHKDNQQLLREKQRNGMC